MNLKLLSNSVVFTSLLFTVTFSGQALSSECKGLENSACSTKKVCSWVEGYERKDGRQVKSFCRTKSSIKKKPKSKDS